MATSNKRQVSATKIWCNIRFNVNILNAFTLAEVLITVGIIGVVASLTIPTLISNIQNYQLKQAWKKEYSSLYNAFNLIINDNGGTFVGLCTTGSISNQTDCGNSLFAGKMNYVKTCAAGNAYGNNNCFGTSNIILYSDGASTSTDNGIRAGATLSDGAAINIQIDTSVCTPTGTYCGNIRIDVNGFKPPNTVGKDVFGLNISPTRLIPYDTSSGACSSSATGIGAGWGCSANYLFNDT